MLPSVLEAEAEDEGRSKWTRDLVRSCPILSRSIFFMVDELMTGITGLSGLGV